MLIWLSTQAFGLRLHVIIITARAKRLGAEIRSPPLASLGHWLRSKNIPEHF